MSKFAHLKALKVNANKTMRFDLPEICVNGVSPTLLLLPATEANKPYFQAILKRAAESRTMRRAAQKTITADVIEDLREEDMRNYAKHVIKGWENMLGADGKPIEFSEEECLEFLQAIDTWVFDLIRNFCTEPTNFAGAIDVDVDAVAKN